MQGLSTAKLISSLMFCGGLKWKTKKKVTKLKSKFTLIHVVSQRPDQTRSQHLLRADVEAV